ncbi:MAG: hypothetical protein ACI35P_01095 [Bacillus sp. (in: firmicutes)]
MDIHFYREGKYGDLIVYAASTDRYLLGKHFTKEGKNEGISWVLPYYNNRYPSTLEKWKKDVLMCDIQNL